MKSCFKPHSRCFPPVSPCFNKVSSDKEVLWQEIGTQECARHYGMCVRSTFPQGITIGINRIYTTEMVTIRTFSNQKPWVDRTIRAAVNQRTAAYNAGLLSGNMSEYKASCYALRRAVRAAKLRYRERIESHFQLNDSRHMWQGLKTICSSGNNSSAEVRADPLLAEELNTFYGRFECNGGATLPISASGSSRQSSDDDHVITVSEDEVWRELRRVNVRKAARPDGITGRVLRSCADQLAGLFTSIFNESLAISVVPTSFKKSVIIPVPKNSKPSCLNDYRPVALTSTVMKVFERLLTKHICSSIPATLDALQFEYIAQIGLLMMPSLRYCTLPSHILTAKMATTVCQTAIH